MEELKEQKDAAVTAAAATAAATSVDSNGGTEGGADPAFGATIAALQTQLREITQAKDEAEQRAAAAVAAEERLEGLEKTHQEVLGEKQSQNDQLVVKVRQLMGACRSLKEQVAAAAAGTAAAAAAEGKGGGGEEVEQLKSQLGQREAENEKLVARLRELAQRYRALQTQSQEGEGGQSPPPPPPAAPEASGAPSAGDTSERLADAELRASAVGEQAAELTRRCEEAKGEHQRAAELLRDALGRLAELEAAGAAAGAAAVADQERALLEQQEANEAGFEKRLGALSRELEASREEKEEVSNQLETKNADLENMVSLFFFCGGGTGRALMC